MGSEEFVSICFSHDNKFLLMLGGGPDFTLVYWTWEKVKLVASMRLHTNVSAPASELYQCSFCPSDANHLAVCGNGYFQFLHLKDQTLKKAGTGPLQKREPQNYLCHAWISDERVIVSTDMGELILIEGGEFRASLSCSPLNGKPIHCVVPHSKGFVTGGGDGFVRYFERADEQSKDIFKPIAITPTVKQSCCAQQQTTKFTGWALHSRIRC